MLSAAPSALWRVAGPQPGAAPFGFKGAVFDFPSSMLSASPSALCLFNVVNPNQPFLSLRVVRPTAPRPVFRMNGQFSLYRIRVHVLQDGWPRRLARTRS